jgi:sulfur carrier protein
MSMMIVYLNNEQFEFSDAKSISEIMVKDLNLNNRKGVAIAVNQEVIPKSDWDSFMVRENDRVTVIKATQGG